ncbi:MAG: hypothetical protein WBG18_23705 [Xanthobacteraceae bacterium]
MIGSQRLLRKQQAAALVEVGAPCAQDGSRLVEGLRDDVAHRKLFPETGRFSKKNREAIKHELSRAGPAVAGERYIIRKGVRCKPNAAQARELDRVGSYGVYAIGPIYGTKASAEVTLAHS